MVSNNDVLNAINGDNQAMEHLYNATYQKLRAVTVSILKNEDDAEDIIQESYIKAFSNLHQLEDAEKFEGWLCRIASNKCKDYLKKHKPVLFSDLNNSDNEDEDPFEWSIEDDSKDYNPEEVAISDDTRRQLMELVNSLPDEQRICLVYYAVEEMKISEIAELLEVPEATVKSRLKYAKNKMKNKIEDLEKKGVKIRGLSGLAVIPFLRYIFAIEAKAATLGSFAVIAKAVCVAGGVTGTTVAANMIAEGVKTVITEVAKQSGTKAAMGIGAKIASIPLVTRIVAGVVAVCVAVGVPVAVHNAVNSANNDVEDVYVKDVKNEISDIQIDFEETAIIDNEDFAIKVLDISIDERSGHNYILKTEIENKTDEMQEFFVSSGYIDGIYLSERGDAFNFFLEDAEAFCFSYEVEPKATKQIGIYVGNQYLNKFVKSFSEIVMIFEVNYNGNGYKEFEAKPIYPLGKENVKKFSVEENFERLIYSDDDYSLYLMECFSFETLDLGVRFYIENRTAESVSFTTENYKINGKNADQFIDYVYIPSKSGAFRTLYFDKYSISKEGISDIETLVLDAKLTDEYIMSHNTYFDEHISIRFKKSEDLDKLEIDKNENVYFIKMDQSCRHDLDGDGVKEDICVTAPKVYYDFYYYPYSSSNYEGFVNIEINGKIFRGVYEGVYLSDYYCIIDIDNSDSKLHLAIQDYGPSSDFSTTIFEYSGNSIESIDTISGVFDYDAGFYDTICYGDGTIGSYRRLGVLQTWFGKTLYKLEGSRISEVEQECYEATKPSNHTLLTDLTVYESPDLNSKKTIIPKNSKITILGTDNEEWLKIEMENSTSCWVKLSDRWYVLVDDSTVLSGGQVFDWLNYAD